MRSAGNCVIGAIALVAVCWSCQTSNPMEFGDAPLLGVVYDETRLPVDGVAIQLLNGDQVTSDVNGRFTLSGVPQGAVQFVAKRPGYRTLDGEFDFSNRTHILYIKLESATSLRREIEEMIKTGSAVEAVRLCDELLEVDAESPVSRFLAGIAFHAAGEIDRAVEQIEWLTITGLESRAIEWLKDAIAASGNAEHL